LRAESRRGGTLSTEDQTALVRASYEMKLYHDIWNAAADNAVDEGSHRLSSGDNPRYGYALLPALLANFVTLRGQGRAIQAHAKDGPPSAEKLAAAAENPQALLGNLGNTVLMVSSLMHGQMSDPATRDALIADLPKLNIHVELLKNVKKPEMTGEECFWDLYEKCQKIANLTPDPALMSQSAEWRAKRDSMQAERNEIHEEIFAEYAAPLVQQQMQKQQDLQKMIDELNKDRKDKGQEQGQDEGQSQGDGTPINVPGPSGGQGNIPVFIPDQPGSHAPVKPGEGVGEEKTVGAHEKDGANGRNAGDPEAPLTPGANPGPKMGGLASGGSSSGGKKGGKATDAIASINLGDGRSLQQLREDPLFGQAIEQVKERLRDMMANFAVPVSNVARDATEFLPGDDPSGRLDLDAVVARAHGKQTGLPRYFRDDVTSHIPPVGDVIFALDTSGSMGWGPGSHAEHLIKSTAIMMLAIQEFNEERAASDLSQMGAYVMLWGNGKPTFLGKPYDGAQQEEIVLKLDEVLDRVLKNKSIEGLHGGTELEGTFKEVLQEYATHRPQSGAFAEGDRRGPVLLVVGSDGEVFDMDNVPLSGILKAMPSLTVDSMLTQGEESPMHQALLSAERAEEHQKPVNVNIDNKAQILPGIVNWLEGRMETFQNAVPWGTQHDAFSENDVAEQAAVALDEFKGQGFATKYGGSSNTPSRGGTRSGRR